MSDDPRSLPERIVCAAMQMEDGHIVAGVRHFSPDMRATLEKLYGTGYHLKVEEQGFLTNRGRFLLRPEARVIAEEQKQILRDVDIGNYKDGAILFSEHIY